MTKLLTPIKNKSVGRIINWDQKFVYIAINSKLVAAHELNSKNQYKVCIPKNIKISSISFMTIRNNILFIEDDLGRRKKNINIHVYKNNKLLTIIQIKKKMKECDIVMFDEYFYILQYNIIPDLIFKMSIVNANTGVICENITLTDIYNNPYNVLMEDGLYHHCKYKNDILKIEYVMNDEITNCQYSFNKGKLVSNIIIQKKLK